MVGLPNVCQIVLINSNFDALIRLEVEYTFPIDSFEINIIEALDIQGDLYLPLLEGINHCHLLNLGELGQYNRL